MAIALSLEYIKQFILKCSVEIYVLSYYCSKIFVILPHFHECNALSINHCGFFYALKVVEIGGQ
jgi:hypothetical protein